jgi:hypothetical protein
VFTPTGAARDALIVTVVLPAGASPPTTTTTTNPPPTGLCGFKSGGAVTKALVIWMENKDYDEIGSSAPTVRATAGGRLRRLRVMVARPPPRSRDREPAPELSRQ